MHIVIILPVALCGRETCSLTLREEHRLRAFGGCELAEMFGTKRENGNCVLWNFMICASCQVLLDLKFFHQLMHYLLDI
jgi:hypothetical protein